MRRLVLYIIWTLAISTIGLYAYNAKNSHRDEAMLIAECFCVPEGVMIFADKSKSVVECPRCKQPVAVADDSATILLPQR